jgi:hypothetical protein
MNRVIIFLSIFSMGLLSGCGSSVRIFSDVDASGTFDNYTTYNFLDFTEGNKKTVTGMELERIRVAFAREIELRGLRFVEENANVSLQITVYHRQSMEPYYYHPYRRNYMERAISVDMYDNRTQKHVWHCAAVGELVYDPVERAELLPEVVAGIFQKYPVQLSGEI